MGTEISLREKGFLVSGETDIKKTLKENFQGMEITPDLLDKIKNPSGTTISFEVEGLEGSETVKSISGVILQHKPQRAYWKEAFGSGSISVPDCYSNDMSEGQGDPGDVCSECEFNEFGSADDGISKACKETMILFVIQKTDYLPIVMQVSPGSLKKFKKYITRLSSHNVPISQVITEISLEKAKSKGGIDYPQMVFKSLGRIDSESVNGIKSLKESLLSSFDKTNMKTINQDPDDYNESSDDYPEDGDTR